MITPNLKVRIKIKLIQNNISQVKLAGELGCSRQQLNNIINGKVQNLKIENAIKERLGIL